MISISAFIISLLGIVVLLYFRLWEIKRGSQLYGVQREQLDRVVVSLWVYIETHVPTFNRAVVLQIYHAIVHYFALIVLSIVKIVERKMVFLLEYVRGKREVKRGVTQSDFLKRVGDHKQRLEKPLEDTIQ